MDLILNSSNASWLRFLEAGLNCIPEKWEFGSDSLTHLPFCCVDAAILQLAGLPKPIEGHAGFAKFRIWPQATSALGHASWTYQSPRGKITCEWRAEEKVITKVTIPPGCEAELIVPLSGLPTLFLNGERLNRSNLEVHETRTNVILELPSGHHVIAYKAASPAPRSKAERASWLPLASLASHAWELSRRAEKTSRIRVLSKETGQIIPDCEVSFIGLESYQRVGGHDAIKENMLGFAKAYGAHVSTDHRGEVRIPRVQSGIMVSAFRGSELAYAVVTEASQATVELILEPVTTLTVKVRDLDGKSVANAEVQLVLGFSKSGPKSSNLRGLFTARCDAQGVARLLVLPAHVHRVRKEVQANSLFLIVAGSQVPGGSVALALNKIESGSFDLVMSQSGSIRIRIEDRHRRVPSGRLKYVIALKSDENYPAKPPRWLEERYRGMVRNGLIVIPHAPCRHLLRVTIRDETSGRVLINQVIQGPMASGKHVDTTVRLP